MRMQRSIFRMMILALALFAFSCKKAPKEVTTVSESQIPTELLRDQVHPFTLSNIRLGDGVPLILSLSVRWNIGDPEDFIDQFASCATYNSLIMQPRMLELISQEANTFPSVDSVFSTHRQDFITAIKDLLVEDLGQDEITVKEVIFTGISFPDTYTKAMEKSGLQKQELERIHQQNILDLAQADAKRKKEVADAKVAIAKAEAEGRIAKMKAQTEKSKRESELAKAETQAQIDRRKAEVEAERLKLLAKAELEKKQDLKNLDVQKQRDLMLLDVDRKKEMNKADFEQKVEMAKVLQENPVYASFLVNKELASKVEIAVLPTGSDPNVFGNLLKNNMPVGKN